MVATDSSFTRIAKYCKDNTTTLPKWTAIPGKTEFPDNIYFPDFPTGDLLITDKKGGLYGTYDLSYKDKVITEMKNHVWHLSVNGTILPTDVTQNVFTLTVSAITKTQVTVVGEYVLATP